MEALKEEFGAGLKISTDERANTGPTIKKLFGRPEALSAIMFCPEDLLEDLLIMFQVLDSGLIVDVDKFKAFTENWLDRFHASEMEWNWLCPTLHFLLHHGWKVKKLHILKVFGAKIHINRRIEKVLFVFGVKIHSSY